MRRTLVVTALFFAGGVAVSSLFSSPPEAVPTGNADKPYAPTVAPASNEAALALKRIRVPQGLRVDLFAAEPLLANPVCFAIDEHNRFYVAETYRLHAGVTDDRGHMDWLDDDLASRTVADRVALYHKHLKDRFDTFEKEHDRVRLIEDTDGDGRADRSTVFADGFHSAASGIGAGLLARGGNVWYTCIPDLWLLRDTKGTGRADIRQSLHTGYGVHVGFLGHDLHGLRMGPDGKLYFSIGDRGFNVRTEGRTVAYPDTGAVLRCNPDGSDLEVVATGLRNPQELAFDQYGNLFTGDNNADHGDAARWVYVVDGGDSGWRMGYQYMTSPTALGPWNAEKIWDTQDKNRAAYIVPPIAHVASGPAGLAYYPGLGLPERYRGHFFLCDFRGSAGGSGIRSFAVKPKGASFEMIDQHECVWSVLATDVDFGMDCALYLTDWVDGWNKPNKGRIYKVSDPAAVKDPVVQSVKRLMAEGMAHRSVAELAHLLEHPDMRVRQEAQFALAEKGRGALPALVEVARTDRQQLARLHAIWGLAQIGRGAGFQPASSPRQAGSLPQEAYRPLLDLTADRDAEVRAQAAKVLGDGRVAAAYDRLLPLLRDAEPRVRFFAALGLGKLKRPEACDAVVQMVRANADQDAYLRHAGVMALTWIDDRAALARAAEDASPAVRLAGLLAYRRLERPEVARFLNDADPRLVVEAARAINDVSITDALPQLAKLIERTGLAEPVLYRVLNAHFRLGQPENARALADFAARADAPAALRLEAMRELADWEKPSGRDRIVGLWRPLTPRPTSVAADVIRARLGGIFSGPDKLRQEAAKVASKFGIKEVGPLLLATVADPKREVPVRVEMLRALDALKDERLPQALRLALADTDPRLRTEGRRVLARVRPEEALGSLKAALADGALTERQGALATLGEMKGPAADQVLAEWLDRLLAGQVDAEVQLDLLEAAAKRPAAEVKRKLAAYEAARPKNDAVAAYREALAGGDAEAGRNLFFHKAEVSCTRCHKVKGDGGDVGPDLTGVGARQKREYLLESIVDPNKQIAKGFETVVLVLMDGHIVSGIVKEETGKEVRLMTAEGKLVTVKKDDIDERQAGKSAMPADIVKSLTKAELRDLVEFLASLKEGGPAATIQH
jgi:quinoprotein glucose dehydrogenase